MKSTITRPSEKRPVGFFKEAIMSMRLVICLVSRNGVDIIIVSRIHSGVSKYEERNGSTTYPASN